MYIHKKLKEILDSNLSDMTNTELDLVIVVSGAEGWGKSFLARGLARYCAKFLGVSFGVDNIHFSVEDYLKASLSGGVFCVNVLDEARKVLNKMRRMSRDNIKFTNYLSECRALRQVHIILAPSFSDLDRYVIAWRMNLLINIDKEYQISPNSESGYKPRFGAYRVFANKKKLIHAYDSGYNYFPSVYECRDRWTPIDVFNTEELKAYNEKKYKATLSKYSEPEKKDVKKLVRDKWFSNVLTIVREREGLTHKATAELLEIPMRSYWNVLNAGKENEKE